MATIKSIDSTDGLKVGTNNAARVQLFDADGNAIQEYPKYRASATVVSAASTAPFFAIYGSASKKIRITKISISGTTLTAIEYNVVVGKKYSTAITVGTPVSLTRVPLDSSDGAATVSICNVYTAAPTAGTEVGEVFSRRFLLEDTAGVAGNQPVVIDFEIDIILNDSTEGVCLAWASAPATAVTLAVEVEWQEI